MPAPKAESRFYVACWRINGVTTVAGPSTLAPAAIGMGGNGSTRDVKPLRIAIKRLMALLLLSSVRPVALLVRWRLGISILFHVSAHGCCDNAFWLLKFRTMNNARVSASFNGFTARLLAAGCVPPRLMSYLSCSGHPARHEMSFIGPRILLMQYLPLWNMPSKLAATM